MVKPTPFPKLYKVTEAAKLLGVSTWTIYKLIDRNEIDAYSPGGKKVVTEDSLRRYLERVKVS